MKNREEILDELGVLPLGDVDAHPRTWWLETKSALELDSLAEDVQREILERLIKTPLIDKERGLVERFISGGRARWLLTVHLSEPSTWNENVPRRTTGR
jgi:hypothetical protein